MVLGQRQPQCAPSDQVGPPLNIGLSQFQHHEGRSERRRPNRSHRDIKGRVAGHHQHASIKHHSPRLQHPQGINYHAGLHLRGVQGSGFRNQQPILRADSGLPATWPELDEGSSDCIDIFAGSARQHSFPQKDIGEPSVLQQDYGNRAQSVRSGGLSQQNLRNLFRIRKVLLPSPSQLHRCHCPVHPQTLTAKELEFHTGVRIVGYHWHRVLGAQSRRERKNQPRQLYPPEFPAACPPCHATSSHVVSSHLERRRRCVSGIERIGCQDPRHFRGMRQ